MPGNSFLLPDDLGWECNDELSKCIDDWLGRMIDMREIYKGMDENQLNGLGSVAKAELIDDMYAIIKKYKK